MLRHYSDKKQTWVERKMVGKSEPMCPDHPYNYLILIFWNIAVDQVLTAIDGHVYMTKGGDFRASDNLKIYPKIGVGEENSKVLVKPYK